MKKILIILGIVLIGLVVLGLVKDQVIKGTLTVAVSKMVGAPVEMDGFRLRLLGQSVEITGFRIYNPEGFSKAALIDIGKIRVALDAGALLKGKLHLRNAELTLKEMTLETNQEGKLNVDALKVAKTPPAKEKEKGPSSPAKQMPFTIDELRLAIGKLVMKDYSIPGMPAIKVNEINIDKTYKNITSTQQLLALILSEPLKAAGIQGAAIYGAAMMTGVGIVPVAIASAFIGKDNVQQAFDASFDKVYDVSLAVLQEMGQVSSESRADGAISATVSKASVRLEVKPKENKTEVTIYARKYMLPEPSIAGGVLYKIEEQLK
ncbi:MAG: AsmA family protein [Candidatus Omnitrophota bacterium]